MAEFLCLTLAAPMASFGSVAGNMSRGTLDRPGHSLIVGLIGAALGLEREDGRLNRLSEGLRMAVAMDRPGRPLRDYHTVQTVKERRGFRPATRRQALAMGDVNTVITERDYLADVCATVAIACESGPFALTEMAEALRRPRFVLYLGRKSCPLSAPVWPRIEEASRIEDALRAYAKARQAHLGDLAQGLSPSSRVAIDARLSAVGSPGARLRRRGLMEDRATWRHRLLEELVLAPTPSKTGDPGS